MSNINVRLAGMRILKTEEARCRSGNYLIEPEKATDLPPGVTQVEYLELLAPKLLSLVFPADDLPRMRELLCENNLEPASHIVPLRAKISIDEYQLVIPETLLGSLSKAEQAKAEKYVPPTQVRYQEPTLFRFIKKCYADELIDKGKLRISSFERCRKQEGGCGDRFDQDEGKGVFSIQAGDFTAEFMLQVGGNPLMLCMSLSPNARKQKDDVCIEIFDLPALIDSVSTALTEKRLAIKRIMHGPCSYADRLFVRKCVKSGHALEKLLEQIYTSPTGFDYDLCETIPLNEIGERHYFTKPMRFSNEHEYRIVWDCDSVPKEGIVDVTLKDVQSFCRLHENIPSELLISSSNN